jgi:DNA adenine methylase
MGFTLSPLRYPGGKSRLAGFIRALIEENHLDGAYAEPFAGGAGVAWALLFENVVSSVYLNDLDPAIYAFWRSLKDSTDELCKLVLETPVNMNVWYKQRAVIEQPTEHSLLELGFATFFLNRTNRSGVIRGGVIGGKGQGGKWKLGCRYNKRDLVSRIEKIARHRKRINLHHLEARLFISAILPTLPQNSFLFADPPYYSRGQTLYLDLYGHDDHAGLAKDICEIKGHHWMVSYDNSATIRRMYSKGTREPFKLSYSVADRYVGSEMLFFSPRLRVPLKSIPRYPVKKAIRSPA